MTDPCATPGSNLVVGRGTASIPWLWSLYNGYVLFSVTMIVIFFATGKTPDLFMAFLEIDYISPGYTRANSILYGLIVLNYLFVLVVIGIGYLLVWRINRFGRIAAWLYALFMIGLLGLGIFSFLSELGLPGYRFTWLDYFASLVGNAWVLALLAWGIRGWNRYRPLHRAAPPG